MGKVSSFYKILFFLVATRTSAVSYGEEDFLLSRSEKITLDKFKQRVIPSLPHDYMKQDVYLIKWLRARNFDLQSAQRMLLDNLHWRKANKMDSILDEDWSEMKEKFYYAPLAVDKSGRPVIELDFGGSWDVRSMALAGESRKYYRYLLRMLEELQQHVVKQQRQGLNVTQWKMLINLEEFSVIQHACPLCLPTYAQLTLASEEHYPWMSDKVIIVNMPPAFQIVLDVMTPLMTPRTRNALKTFGYDKKRWMDYLRKEIDEEQLGVRFGGKRKLREIS